MDEYSQRFKPTDGIHAFKSSLAQVTYFPKITFQTN